MTKILPFPKPLIKVPKGYPRQQLFLIGKIYNGPAFDRKVTYYYIRRNEIINNIQTWSLKIFKKQKGSNDFKFVDVDSCTENGVVEMLEKWNLFNQVTYKKLHRIGWKGTIKKQADIFAFKSSR